MDVAEYKAIFEDHQQEMASHLEAIERFEDRIDTPRSVLIGS